MRKPEQAPEPSIEEILASIRRIIADDTPAAAVVDVDNSEVAAQAEQVPAQAYAGGRRIRTVDAGPRQGEPRSEDEVLELTEDFMLAEEAPAVRLQEPQEPAELYSNGHDDRYGAQDDGYGAQNDQYGAEDDGYRGTRRYQDAEPSYRDPYDVDAAMGQGRQPARGESADAFGEAEAEDEAQEQQAGASAAQSDDGLANVMAEVGRFVGLGRVAEPDEAEQSAEPADAAEPEPETGFAQDIAAAAQAPEPTFDATPAAKPAAESWGQPDFEALAPEPARPAPRWSARGKPQDAGKAAETPAAARSTATPAARPASQPNLAGPEGWSQGVQMPVPEDGPAIPFAEALAEHAAAETTSPQPNQAAPAAPDNAEVELPAATAEDSQPAPAAGLQARAEQLAERAVADFAADRLSIPPVAEILKADRPLMDHITTTVANALSKGAEQTEEFEDTPPEAFGEDGFSPEPAAAPARAAAGQPAAAAPAPTSASLEIGFLSARNSAPTPATPVPTKGGATTEPETPELPREDDDLMLLPVEPADAPAYRPNATMEPPLMSQTPQAPARMTSLPTTALSAGREVGLERLQAAGMPKTLEDTVREMLKPLLVQWLNENMPRIINDAIREEMAAAGLLSRGDPER